MSKAKRKNVSVANNKNRIPEKGDRVTAAGHEGVFVVYNLDDSLEVAELKQIGRDLALSTVPWRTLTFLEKRKPAKPLRGSCEKLLRNSVRHS